ncbi:hypothetical protein PIB30_055561 [Stylosanthes scabra]|uniref:Uncharacterized protein n=1 Tax=Stylosanthes scabra TaxID=79078 RepID=A0ABU6XIW6_9FABA|nr:hypothetical protein [Stylosanthes scabra]
MAKQPRTQIGEKKGRTQRMRHPREITIISGGIPEEGKPPSRKAAKRSRHSCLAVEVMPRPLAGSPPPAIVFSSEEIRQTTNNMNQPLEAQQTYCSEDALTHSASRKATWKHTPTT